MCGDPGPVTVERRWWRARQSWHSPEGEASGRGEVAVGRGWVRRAWRPPSAFAALVPGEAHLGVEEVPDAWWTAVLVREGRVLGTVEPTWARLGLAVSTAILGAVAAEDAVAVRIDVRRWERRGEARREVVLPLGGGLELARAPAARPQGGLRGRVLRGLDDAPRAVSEHLEAQRRATPQELPHGWLALADRAPRDEARQVWSTWIEAEPDASAAVVREVLVGLGALADQGSASRSTS